MTKIANDAQELAWQLAPFVLSEVEKRTATLTDYEVDDFRNHLLNYLREVLTAKTEAQRATRLVVGELG